MPSKTDVETARALAERLGATCTEAMLDWGEAINDYESTPEGDSCKSLKLTIVRARGGQAMDLAQKLASKLRPRKG